MVTERQGNGLSRLPIEAAISKGNRMFRQQLNEHVEFKNTKSCGLYFEL